MNIPEIEFVGVPDYLQKIQKYPNIAWIYRGHADSSWELIPSAGRPEYFLPNWEDKELDHLPPRDICRFNDWRNQAVAYKKDLPENDFECLAYAQHYGLATRLMDWSTNPLVALFFAVDSCSEESGCVYCYTIDKILLSEEAKLGVMPYVCQYRPPPVDKRVLMQNGVFTYHSEPNIPLKVEAFPESLAEAQPDHGKNLVRFIIAKGKKAFLKKQLDEIGINRKTLFPDIEGLSNYINWETTRMANNKGR